MPNRPVLHIPKPKVEMWHDVVCIVVLIATVGYPFFVWPQLPASIPVHFNAAGEPDGWGGKAILLLLPALSLLVYVGFTILRKYPHRYNYMQAITADNAHRQYLNGRLFVSWIKVQIVVLLGYIQSTFIQSVLAGGSRLQLWLLLALIIILLGSIIAYTVQSVRAK